MSDYCRISFKHVNTDDIFPLLSLLKKSAIAHIQDIAQENCTFMPIPQNKETWQTLEISNREIRSNLILWGRSSVFTYRFFYIEEFNLIGIFGLPDALCAVMEGSIVFQNCSDTDYHRSEYGEITEFTAIYDKWIALQSDELLQLCSSKNIPLDDEDKIRIQTDPDFLTYQLRCMAYSEVWSYCKQAFFDDDSVTYLSLFGTYDLRHMIRFAKYCIDSYKITMAPFLEDNDNNYVLTYKKEMEEKMKYNRMDKETIEKLFPIGTTIVLDHMVDEYPIPDGSIGVITDIDDMGQIRCNWNTGRRSIGIIPGVDQFHAVPAVPDCYCPEPNNPYPLCVGNESESCKTCCLYTNMDSPY